MKNIKEATEQELEYELALRKKAKLAPKPLDKPDFSNLVKMILSETEYLTKHGHSSKDFDHYVYEEAITTIYGNSYWDWFNSFDQ